MASSVLLSLPPRRESRSPYIARFARYYQERLLHGRCFRNLRETSKPLALASRPTSIGPDRRRTLAHGSTYAPTTRAVKMQLAPHAVPSSSVDEVQPASSCRCRCRPAGVAAETTAVDRNYSSRNHSSTPASTTSLSIGRGDVVRTARLPLLHPCRYAREKLSVRESDRRCSPLALCPKRISVGRPHQYRKRTSKYVFNSPCLLYTSPSPRDLSTSRMPSSA